MKGVSSLLERIYEKEVPELFVRQLERRGGITADFRRHSFKELTNGHPRYSWNPYCGSGNLENSRRFPQQVVSKSNLALLSLTF
jgi:hypothetical protein